MNLLRAATVGLSVLAGAGAATADDGITIGRHSPGPGGVSALHAHVDLPLPFELAPSIFPGFPGFAEGEFGFSNAPINEEEDDLFMISEASDIYAVLTDVSPSLRVFNGPHLMAPGDSMHFGHPFFDYHPVYNLPAGGNGYARFELHDASGTYTDSDGFVLFFLAVNHDCPADLGSQGGVLGADGTLDNNDFIAFIDRFFEHDSLADRGSQGGVHAPDGAFDNNDFVVFIAQFFASCV
jgi:hypothetical protein